MRSLGDYGVVPEFLSLSICPTCLELFDEPRQKEGMVERQQCDCDRDSSMPPWQTPYRQYDFNERAGLCDGCTRAVLTSGSRWSVWFCTQCKERVIALNQEFGFAVIPIGRHSLMNGFALRPGLSEEENRLRDEFFCRRFQDMGRRIDMLHEWKSEHLRRELERLGLVTGERSDPPAIPLVAYLQAVVAEDESSTVDHRLAAFRGLADRFEVWQTIDPKEW
jgi:hypothetical protein